MPNDIVVARYVPPVSVPDMERMAHAVVQSQLFGIKTVPQALTLMLLAQAEGRHPVLAARDYDIIGGKPAKKAEAMLRDFLASGGEVKWHELTDDLADATFAHPRGGEVRITWDMDRAKRAGLVGKPGDMYRKFARQMLRSRCVSEGVRTVGPMATSGMYVPEEIRDSDHAPMDAMQDVTPAWDEETGEIAPAVDSADLESAAQEAAGRGTEALRTHLKSLPREHRNRLREAIGTVDDPGPLLRMAQEADSAAQAERLRTPDPTELPLAPAGDPPDAAAASPLAGAAHRWPMPRDPSARDWQAFADWLDAKLSDGIAGRALRADNETALKRLKRDAPDIYDDVQARLTAGASDRVSRETGD